MNCFLQYPNLWTWYLSKEQIHVKYPVSYNFQHDTTFIQFEDILNSIPCISRVIKNVYRRGLGLINWHSGWSNFLWIFQHELWSSRPFSFTSGRAGDGNRGMTILLCCWSDSTRSHFRIITRKAQFAFDDQKWTKCKNCPNLMQYVLLVH